MEDCTVHSFQGAIVEITNSTISGTGSFLVEGTQKIDSQNQISGLYRYRLSNTSTTSIQLPSIMPILTFSDVKDIYLEGLLEIALTPDTKLSQEQTLQFISFHHSQLWKTFDNLLAPIGTTVALKASETACDIQFVSKIIQFT